MRKNFKLLSDSKLSIIIWIDRKEKKLKFKFFKLCEKTSKILKFG